MYIAGLKITTKYTTTTSFFFFYHSKPGPTIKSNSSLKKNAKKTCLFDHHNQIGGKEQVRLKKS